MTFQSPYTFLPTSFLPLLELLTGFQTDVITWMSEPDENDKAQQAPFLKNRYQALTKKTPYKKDPINTIEADRAFAEGVLKALHLKASIVDEHGIIDTFGSKTLSHFDTDYRGAVGDKALVIKALKRILSLSNEEMMALEKNFEIQELTELEQRKRIIRAIGELYDFHDPDENLLLFQAFYPEFKEFSRAEGVRLIRTASSIFFCVPFASVSHLSRKESKLSDNKVARLWGRFRSQKQVFMAHFPMFGFFEGTQIEEGMMKKIATKSELPISLCQELLTSMISILASESVDKYIIHDVWGHQWQALLFDFENTYRDAAKFGEVEEFNDNGPLQELIRLGTINVDENWREKVENYFLQLFHIRLVHSLSALFAEVLADAMEYKFLYLNPGLVDEMPSSSFLKEWPAKLDLTLHDLPIYFRFAFRAIRALNKTENQDELIDNYILYYPDQDRTIVRNVVEEFTKIGFDLSEKEKGFAWKEEKDRLVLDAHAQFAIQFYQLVESYNEVVLSAEVEKEKSKIFRRHFDVLVFSTSSFYERDRQEHFWEIDTFVKEAFPPRYFRFQQELRKLEKEEG